MIERVPGKPRRAACGTDAKPTKIVLDEPPLKSNSTYVYQPYPKLKYHWSGKTTAVQNAEEDAALCIGWAETPAAFHPFQGERPPRSAADDPTRCVDAWRVDGLAPEQRRKIQAELLRADALFEQAFDKEDGMIAAMRRAFHGIAKVLLSARVLTKPMLYKEIPELVWASAIAARWWRRADASPSNLFPYPAGHHWIWLDHPADRDAIFRAEVREWTAALLELPNGEENSPSPETRRPEEQPQVSALAVEATGDDAFTSETERIEALEQYTRLWQCAEAALARAAGVHPVDLSKWKKGKLPRKSDKKARIEKALLGNTPPKQAIPKSRF
jgi:hypothetical protein